MKDNVWSLYYIQPYVNTSKNNCLIRSLWGGTGSSTETKRNTQLCTFRQWRGACTSYTPNQHWLSSQEETCHLVPSHCYLPRTYLLPNSQPKTCLFQVSTPSTSSCIWEAVCTSSGKTCVFKTSYHMTRSEAETKSQQSDHKGGSEVYLEGSGH